MDGKYRAWRALPEHDILAQTWLATILCIVLVCFLPLLASAQVILDVEPRIATLDGVLRIHVIEAPGPIVVRLEGPVTTSYVSLEPGSTAALNLAYYGLKPGLYYVTAYDAPGGRKLASTPILVVRPVISVKPPHPVVSKPFRILVAIEPPGYAYTVAVKLDGSVIGVTTPGTPLQAIVSSLKPHRVCIDVSVVVEGVKLHASNVTCRVIQPDQPPRIYATIDTVGSSVTLTINVEDVDGVVVAANYSCTLLDLHWSGYLESTSTRIRLFTFDDLQKHFGNLTVIANATLTCTITAIDDFGAKSEAEVYETLGDLIPRAMLAPAAVQRQATTPPRQPQPAIVQPAATRNWLLMLVLAVPAVAGMATYLVLRKRRGRQVEEKMPYTSVSEIEEKLEEIETRLTRMVERLNELEFAVRELKDRVARLERERGS